MDSRILHYEFVTGESVNITVSAEIAVGYLRFPPHGTRQQRAFALSLRLFLWIPRITREQI